jgi:hypothetical protein
MSCFTPNGKFGEAERKRGDWTLSPLPACEPLAGRKNRNTHSVVANVVAM